MRTSSSFVNVILASAVVTFAIGCSGESQSQASMPFSPSATQTQPHSSTDLARSGVSPKVLALLQFGQAAPHAAKATAKDWGLKDLFVSSFLPQHVSVLKNKTYKSVGTISKGLISPDGVFADAAGDLYVADYDGVDIQEYKPGSKSPSFTYNAGMVDPVNVSVDSQGNVYEADFDGWFVNEYAQKNNTVINSCALDGAAEGVAVDANNDVFVDYNLTPSGTGKIVEFKGGLAGCQSTPLDVTLTFAGGMVLDAKGNLVVCDLEAPAVDIIAPPFSSVKATLGSGYVAPFHVALDKSNKRAFVSDLYYNVFVVHYASGSLVTKLPSGNGWTYPAGVVDEPNAVY